MHLTTRLPVSVERGAVFKKSFRTSVQSLASGHEARNSQWSNYQASADIGYTIRDMFDADAAAGRIAIESIAALWVEARGRKHTFGARDWSDYILSRQSIGTGTGAPQSIQLSKRYGADDPYSHPIRLPILGTVTVWVGGISAGGWTLDYLTGMLTINAALDADIEIACEFDRKCRFDTDELGIRMESIDLAEIPSIPVIEVKGE